MRLRLSTWRGALAALALVALGCTDADVFETPGLGKSTRDDKLKVAGSFCSEHPDELKFPVKILFIIDCSQSMLVTDPAPSPNELPGRVQAVLDVVQKFRSDPGVSFAIVRFEAAANVATQTDTNGDGIADMFGFVNDLPSLLRAINSLVNAGGNTNYQAALGLAEATLAMDMSITPVDERARTKYVVIFLSDGFPYPQDYDQEVNTPRGIRRALEEMMKLPRRFDVADFSFHTCYLSAGTPAHVAQQAEGLLKQMAQIGNGTYRNFANGEEINFLYIDFTSIKRMFSLKNGAFVAFNNNARPAPSHDESVDTDGDGLIDQLEVQLGIDFGSRDTDGDGFNDFLEYNLRRSGFDPLDPQDADCSLELDRMDSDGDGLLNCEERFVGTSPDLFDTDTDGIADPVEILGGTNPVWNDVAIDLDFDGSLNGAELAWHTNPGLNDAAMFSKLAYRYDLKRWAGFPEGRVCYDFSVDNITLTGTQPRKAGDPQGFNDIYVYAGQVPQDDPLDYGVFRVACARARYIPRYPEPDIKFPPGGVVKFEQKDFKRPVATRCGDDTDCPHQVCDPRMSACLAPFGQKCDAQTPCPHFACQDIDQNTGKGKCLSPMEVNCFTDEDCPRYPRHPTSGACLDPQRSPPDASGLCSNRPCLPLYFTCSAAKPCAPDGDSKPENDPECLGGFCRVPCATLAGCNPGETCEPDPLELYPPCNNAAECGTGSVDCLGGRCRRLCATDADCPKLNQTCQEGLCVSRHCVNRQGGVCAGVECAADTDCPLQPCDGEIGRCLVQPCIDSRQCPHQKCELVLGFCLGPACQDDGDCRGERGYTCNQVVGDPCDRDIDCPYNFCNQRRHRCFYGGQVCQKNADCAPNLCSVRVLTACATNADCPGGTTCVNQACVGACTLGRTACSADLDCPFNYCQPYYVCENDPDKGCVTSLDCPQTYCRADGKCINNPSVTCNPDSENRDDRCKVGMCHRENSLGSCDTPQRQSCSKREDCPHYRCNLAVGECYYPSQVSCRQAADCPEAGMICGPNNFCVKTCNSDADCPRARCQGRCVPLDPADRQRCTDWFDADRDCRVYGMPRQP